MSATIENYYKIMGLESTCTQDEIHSAHRVLNSELHPDLNDSEDAKDRLCKINEAYEILKDEAHRAQYDIIAGFRPNTEEERRRVRMLRRKQAELERSAMEESVEQMRSLELEKGEHGLLILDARYGAFDITPQQIYECRSSDTTCLFHLINKVQPGRYIDVTVQLQLMVNDSNIIYHTDGKSKSELEGFYDPSGQQNQLYIRYRYYNHIHEACINDFESFAIPMEEHVLSNQDENLFKRVTVSDEKRIKAKRRLILFSTLAAIVGGYVIYTNKFPQLNQTLNNTYTNVTNKVNQLIEKVSSSTKSQSSTSKSS